MEVLPYDKYHIRVDGSRRVTTRNRRYLKFFKPISTTIDYGKGYAPIESTVEGKGYTNGHPTNRRRVYPADNDLGIPPVIPDTTVPVNSGSDAETTVSELPDASSPDVSKRVPPRTPLMKRRLRSHNPDGVKQAMLNPGGRR